MKSRDDAAIVEDRFNDETKPSDEPLFVLRCEPYKMTPRCISRSSFWRQPHIAHLFRGQQDSYVTVFMQGST